MCTMVKNPWEMLLIEKLLQRNMFGKVSILLVHNTLYTIPKSKQVGKSNMFNSSSCKTFSELMWHFLLSSLTSFNVDVHIFSYRKALGVLGSICNVWYMYLITLLNIRKVLNSKKYSASSILGSSTMYIVTL